MAVINRDDLQPFLSQDVGVTIYDHTWKDQSPMLEKTVHHVGMCPEHTHLRIYFDARRFFAVPLTATVTISEDEWSAFDPEAGLHYVIKKGRTTDD